MHVKKGDKVIILTGKDKNQTGEVVHALPKKNKVIIAGLNKSKRHQRPRRQGAKGQILEKEMPIHVSNVKLIKK